MMKKNKKASQSPLNVSKHVRATKQNESRHMKWCSVSAYKYDIKYVLKMQTPNKSQC